MTDRLLEGLDKSVQANRLMPIWGMSKSDKIMTCMFLPR